MSFAWASQSKSKSSKIPRRLTAVASSSSPISALPKYNNTGHATETACSPIPTPPPAERADHANHTQHDRRGTSSRVPRLSATSGSFYPATRAHPSAQALKSHADEQRQHRQHSPSFASSRLANPNADRIEHEVQQPQSAYSTPFKQDVREHHTGTTDQALPSNASTPPVSALRPLRLSMLSNDPGDHDSKSCEKIARPRLMRPKTFSVSMSKNDTAPPHEQLFDTSSSTSKVGEDAAASPDVFSSELSYFMRTSSFSYAHPGITRSASAPTPAPAPTPPSPPSSSSSSPTPHTTFSPPSPCHSTSSPSSYIPTPTPFFSTAKHTHTPHTPFHSPNHTLFYRNTPHTPIHALPFLHARATETRHVLAALESSIASILHMSNSHDETPCMYAYVHTEAVDGGDGYCGYV